MRRPLIGVMGAGRNATEDDCELGRQLGSLVAGKGWVLLSGGTALGVMDASCKAASDAGGLVVGVIAQSDDRKMSKYVDVPIFTGMLTGRNFINCLTSDVMIACGTMAAGTLSEVAMSLRADKDVILLGCEEDTQTFLKRLGGDKVHVVDSPEDAIAVANELLKLDRPIAGDQVTA
jgi:uncharacterized protein (TIGR00725 family)